MDKSDYICNFRLLLRKIEGCYREFGYMEALRRVVLESISCIRRYDDFDISMITEKLAIGSAPRSPSSLRRLVDLGFKHIIDLRAERSRSDTLVSTRDIEVCWIPIYDDWRPIPMEFFNVLFRETNRILLEKGTKLFICCGAGKHRSPLAGVVALMSMGFSMAAAENIIHKARPQVELLTPYKSSLARFVQDQKDVC
jgi:hypothetical protein